MNILTFDIEEWFHILDNDSTKSEDDWRIYEVRIHENTDRILEFLVKNNLRATFFIVGWIAEKYPEIVKKIDNLGYEIGSHTHMHQLMYEQSRSAVDEDLKRSIRTLESLIGKKITCFRAPGFSITEQNKWVFEVLWKNGITHDSSVFPAGRAHGGMPDFGEVCPSRIIMNGLEIREFPINATKLLGRKWIYSGGGYFRLTPYSLIKKWSLNDKYIMTYFHPRDFDPNQPVIRELSVVRKFKSYVGLKGCLPKLDKWVNEFDFIDLATADKKINWKNTPIVKL